MHRTIKNVGLFDALFHKDGQLDIEGINQILDKWLCEIVSNRTTCFSMEN